MRTASHSKTETEPQGKGAVSEENSVFGSPKKRCHGLPLRASLRISLPKEIPRSSQVLRGGLVRSPRPDEAGTAKEAFTQ